MENGQNGPVIPSGTEENVYGQSSFTQNPGQPEVPPEGKVESGGEPQLTHDNAQKRTTFDELAAKKGFKSADDLAEAYSNLESLNTRVEMGFSELAKLKNNPQPQEETVPPVGEVETPEQALRVVENVVKRFTKPLQDKLDLQDLFLRYPDAKEVASLMADIVKRNPAVDWDTAYFAAKSKSSITLSQKAKEEGKQLAYQEIYKKQAASVGTTKPTQSERSLAELVKDRTIPFREVQKIMRERFSQ